MMALRSVIVVFLLLLTQNAYASCPSGASCTHAIAMFGEPKYAEDFTHFDYVNPDAPKGGDVKLAAIGTFDSLNNFILKGIPAAGVGMIYDTLLVSSDDEPFTKYGLLAESIELPEDRNWVSFTLRKEARWHDGTPVTADDVVFSFNTLTTKGHPFYRSYYHAVAKAEALSPHTVKFTFAEGNNRELPLIVGDLPIISEAYYSTHDFSSSSLTPPLGSGAYKVDEVNVGKWVRYKRVDDYWGKDLPVNRGRYNFDTITYDYYRDANVAVEAFKAGEYDFRQENISKQWANAYDIAQVKDGRIVKEEIPAYNPTGMQAFVFNTRLEKFSDPRVRRALAYAFDFEWTNKNLFYDAYTRTKSYFSNSDFASHELPSAGELALLEPYRDQLPPELFTEVYEPPSTDGSGNIRSNLIKARDLLKDAGWTVNDGALTHQTTGQVMEIEFLFNSPTFERIAGAMIQNLKKLGIHAEIRTVDSAQYIKRTESFDFDVIMHVFGQSSSPGNEQKDYWHSSNANIQGSRNLIGVNNPAVDALVEKVISANSKEELVDAVRALDRVLLFQHYVIPNWHVNVFRVIYWNKLKRPSHLPRYSLAFDAWWVEQ